MGLISFLKNKFSKKNKEVEKETEIEEIKENEAKEEPASASEVLTSSEESSLEEKPSLEEKEEPVVEETAVTEGASVESEPDHCSAPLPVEEKKEEVPVLSEETEVQKDEEISSKEETEVLEELAPVIEEKKGNEAPAVKEEAVKNENESGMTSEEKYVAGLDKSRLFFTERLKKLAKSNKIVNQEYFDNLERILIEADVGVNLSIELIQQTAREASMDNITDPEALNDLLIDKMFISYVNQGGTFSTDIAFHEGEPTVLFMCGVNGVGKTTTVAKLAYKYKNKGKKVLLVAGDTFRAGAVEQLTYWANKVGVDIMSRPNSDPASLCYDSMKKALDEKYDLVIVDTAGRLQNKKGLMDELSKMVRVIKKVIPSAPHESLLIIDANTGQNGIDQALVFKEAVAISGIIITKMDGSSKGGIILSIRDRLALPVKFIGLGEKMDQLEEFDLDKYLYGLLVGNEE